MTSKLRLQKLFYDVSPPLLTKKHAEACAQGVAVPDRFRFRIAARGMRGRFGRYSKSETAKCRPVEDLSALNQTSGQERKQGAAKPRCVRPNPRRTMAQRHTILLLKASAPLKRESFIFKRYTHHRERREREQSQPYANNPILSFAFLLSRSPQ